MQTAQFCNFFGLFYCAVNIYITYRRIIRNLMNDELERTRKDAPVAHSIYYPGICLKWLRKNKKNLTVVYVSGNIRNKHTKSKISFPSA